MEVFAFKDLVNKILKLDDFAPQAYERTELEMHPLNNPKIKSFASMYNYNAIL